MNVDDIVETVNHFRCIDQIIELANYNLSEAFIKQLHYILKSERQIAEKRGLLLVNINVLKMRGRRKRNSKASPCIRRNAEFIKLRYNLSKQKDVEGNNTISL